MSLSGIAASLPFEAPPVEAASKKELDKPNDTATSAFAATLASAMSPAPAAPPKPEKAEPSSELDARTAAITSDSKSDKPVFAAAAEARSAAANAPVTEVNADTDALNPEFRARLGRVVSRMHDEFGYDVQMVEGYRPQSRQDFLYEQGRTRAGEVVTWTKSSKHTQGAAADLMIDGSYDNAEGYQRLAQIAAQEGLRTLGARDPGHVELPTRNGAAAWGSSTDSVNIDGGLSRAVGLALAPETTSHEAPDTDTNSLNGFLSRFGRGGSSIQPMHTGAASGGMSGGMSGDASRDRNSDRDREPAVHIATAQIAKIADVATIASVARVAEITHTAPSATASFATPASVAPAAGSEAAERVGRMLDVRDASPAQPLSHVTLNLDGGTGPADRITVQLRSGAIDTTIAVSDANRADRMSLRVGELQHALEQQGLEASSIRVASTGTETSAGWTSRDGANANGDGRQPLNYRDHRQDADEARQRSRREQQGEKGK